MILFRRSCAADLDAIYTLALHGGYGITTLPKDRELLEVRLARSLESFAKKTGVPQYENYLFVLEDTISKKVAGVSAIEAFTGYETPFYSYKLSKRSRVCPSLSLRNEYEELTLVNDNQGRSELCTLFLEPAFRINGNGLLLSRARFLFMAQFPQRFSPVVIAEMRGVSDEKGYSPFWQHIGRHFFNISFAKADSLCLSTSRQFIADLLPENPVIVALLNPQAQAVIGKPHPSTVPAMNILLQEGFRYNNYVHIFDGGPTIEAAREQIKTIRTHRLLPITNLSDRVSSKRFILSNTRPNFRAIISQALIYEKKQSLVISKEAADVLEVAVGDNIRLSPLHFEAK